MDEIDFDKCGGLVPVVTVDACTNKVLMVAYVNKEAFDYTIKTGKATYFSRSRNKLWCKGEESGNYQEIVDILIDCDCDTLIYKVNQKGLGAACHTGRVSCFYRHYVDGKWIDNGEEAKFEPSQIYKSEK